MVDDVADVYLYFRKRPLRTSEIFVGDFPSAPNASEASDGADEECPSEPSNQIADPPPDPAAYKDTNPAE